MNEKHIRTRASVYNEVNMGGRARVPAGAEGSGDYVAVTIHDVAREAGTTIGTVSKALNNSYTISGEMTAHVKAVAERLGYRPNTRAQTLAKGAGREVIFLAHMPRDIAFTNPHMFEIMAGAEAALAAKGYAFKLRGCGRDDVCAVAKDAMDGKLADGLLLHASVVTRDLSVLLPRINAPHIIIGKPGFSNSLCWIDNNNRLAGELAAGYLYDLKHRGVAFIEGLEEDRISQDRLSGVKTKLKEHGLDTVYIMEGESTVESGAAMAKELLVYRTRPTAVICANNIIAFGCLRAFNEAGVRVPQDISLMTFDDYPLAQLASPAFTTVSIDVFEMGLSAGKLLIGKIKKPELQVQTFTTMPKLAVRGSTAEYLPTPAWL